MSDPSDAEAGAPHTHDDDVDDPKGATRKARQSDLLDESLEETFPASDAPTPKHIT